MGDKPKPEPEKPKPKLVSCYICGNLVTPPHSNCPGLKPDGGNNN